LKEVGEVDHKPQLNRTHPPVPQAIKDHQPILLSSLDEALNDAKTTIDELNPLVDSLTAYELDPSMTKTKAKKMRETRNRLVDQSKDVQIRYNQIMHMADKYQSLPRSTTHSVNKTNTQSNKQSVNHSISQSVTQAKKSPHTSPQLNKQAKTSANQSHDYSHYSHEHDHSNNHSNGLHYQQSALIHSSNDMIDPYLAQDAAERLSLIQSIEADASLVHDMCQDIHSMVTEQGYTVSHIEDAIDQSAHHSIDASTQLLQVEHRQSRKRRRMMWCTVMGSIIAFILLMIIYILNHVSRI
jgi:hypothetical protein